MQSQLVLLGRGPQFLQLRQGRLQRYRGSQALQALLVRQNIGFRAIGLDKQSESLAEVPGEVREPAHALHAIRS